MEDLNINLIIDHIILLQQKEKFKERKEVYNVEDELKNKLFDNNMIVINQISPSIEETNKSFYNNHNKMILLSILFSINDEFRKLNFLNQMNLVNSIYDANIKNYIITKNEKNKRFFKIQKKSLLSYYESNDYSNAIIDFYANILNINIFIIEFNNGKYYIGLFSLSNIFNPNKPSIIIWHPNKLMYYPISYKDIFKFYKNNEITKDIFTHFLNNKVFFIQPNIENNLFIKDINVSFETNIIEDYDDDLNIIYIYKTTLSRKPKKSSLNKKSITNTDNKDIIIDENNNIENNEKDIIIDENIKNINIDENIKNNEKDINIDKNNKIIVEEDINIDENIKNDKKNINENNKIIVEEEDININENKNDDMIIEDNKKTNKSIKVKKNKNNEDIEKSIEDTETNIKKVMVITDFEKVYTKEELKKFTIDKLKNILNENNISIRGLKKKDQFINAYLDWQDKH